MLTNSKVILSMVLVPYFLLLFSGCFPFIHFPLCFVTLLYSIFYSSFLELLFYFFYFESPIWFLHDFASSISIYIKHFAVHLNFHCGVSDTDAGCLYFVVLLLFLALFFHLWYPSYCGHRHHYCAILYSEMTNLSIRATIFLFLYRTILLLLWES